MPELPEVETIRIQLDKYLVGHTIKKAEVKTKKIFPENSGIAVGAKITSVNRMAKILIINLNNGYSLLIHLKMTGQPIYRGSKLAKPPGLSKKVAGGVPGKHTHVIFHLNGGAKFYFNDYRKFGWIKVVPTKNLDQKLAQIQKLGPEPKVAAKTLGKIITGPKEFGQIITKSSRPIKVVLMDQSKISGVGNIYANEALWLAKINPRFPADKLSQPKIKLLYNMIIKVLKHGLKYKGASQDAYVNAEGGEGEYQNHFLVYDRKDKRCLRPDCKKKGVVIKKVKLGGRGTYFCPNCQK